MSQILHARGRAAVTGLFEVVNQAKDSVNEQWKTMTEGKPYPRNTMLSGLLDIVREKGDKAGWTVADVQTEAWAVRSLLHHRKETWN